MINPEYLQMLKSCGLSKNIHEEAKGIHFGFLMTYKDDFPALKEYLLNEDREIFPYEEFQVYQINLCKTNTDTLKPELKVPLFAGVSNDEFSIFLDLLSQYHVSSKGHLNNSLDFSIFDRDTKVDKKALEIAKTGLDKFDINKAAIVISNYYETTKYATKLAAYLGGSAFLQDYKSYSV